MVTQCKKRLNTTDYGLITKHLLAVMGPGKRSAVGRWTRAHRSLAPEVVSELKRLKRVPDAVVLDNPWLMGDGPKAKQRLTGVYAVKALLLWERAQEEQRPFTADTFQKEVCALASAFHYRCKEKHPPALLLAVCQRRSFTVVFESPSTCYISSSRSNSYAALKERLCELRL